MNTYQKHESSNLNALFKLKPYQGQNPEKAKVIFLGDDANYSDAISNTGFFKIIEEYHVDGVQFWKKYGVHHPFLLKEYPLKRNTGGVPYHRIFSNLGLSVDYADFISFVELLNVPTTGNTSENIDIFWSLIDPGHLQWIESILISNSPKVVFMTRRVYRNLLAIKKKHNIFSWLPAVKVRHQGLISLYNENDTEIIVSYSFSSSQIHNEMDNIRVKIDSFIK